ncbi:hypothetical protein [Xanthobacter autotrophicus]|uniref:hypothetical protein n=1 Tax=Xanthobacter autotrophicus TaxID=280 RepID=UPI00372A1C91
MNAHLKILATLGTVAFVGIGIINSAFADEYTAKENEAEYQVFANDYANGHDRPLFFANRPHTVNVPNVLRHPAPATMPATSADPHWGPAQDATSEGF